MMKLAELYNFAQNSNILVINGKLSHPALSISDKGEYTVVIDDRQLTSQADELVKAAHEIGHCETGAFYDVNSLETRSRCEYRADKWAIKKLVPIDELTEVLKNGISEIWELAEWFGVTEDFMRKACRFYRLYEE